MANVVAVSDYIIFRLKSEGINHLDTLKHQKLLYYVQAWHLAFNKSKIFEDDFQAWIHGPVNRTIYDLYKDRKNLYSEMDFEDIVNVENISCLTNEEKLHIDSILESYAQFSSTQLENMTHNEDPWINARKGYSSYSRCEDIIDPVLMQDYYAARLD
ncbi:Panacea domain-containing protein [Flavobacterium sp.]|uniref:Panacea domain-containing protein n=1 Tax=Flavobacterium sp. TaxID=239 RepID=UPI004034D71B